MTKAVSIRCFIGLGVGLLMGCSDECSVAQDCLPDQFCASDGICKSNTIGARLPGERGDSADVDLGGPDEDAGLGDGPGPDIDADDEDTQSGTILPNRAKILLRLLNINLGGGGETEFEAYLQDRTSVRYEFEERPYGDCLYRRVLRTSGQASGYSVSEIRLLADKNPLDESPATLASAQLTPVRDQPGVYRQASPPTDLGILLQAPIPDVVTFSWDEEVAAEPYLSALRADIPVPDDLAFEFGPVPLPDLSVRFEAIQSTLSTLLNTLTRFDNLQLQLRLASVEGDVSLSCTVSSSDFRISEEALGLVQESFSRPEAFLYLFNRIERTQSIEVRQGDEAIGSESVQILFDVGRRYAVVP